MITSFNQYLNEQEGLGLDAYSPDELGELLIQECEKEHPDLEKIRDILATGANAHYERRDFFDGLPALHTAIKNGHIEVINLLIEEMSIGPDNPNAATLLPIAAVYNRPKVIQLFLDKGFDINAPSAFEATALHGAASHNNTIEALELLIQRGASLDVQDRSGCTPLSYAAQLNVIDNAHRLISAGADVNLPDYNGHSPLHFAAGYIRPEIVKMLLDAGASKDAKDNQGKTPWDLAPEKIKTQYPELQP